MSDLLQTATKYRNRLKAELAKVEEFLRMAEELSKGRDLEDGLPFSKAPAGAIATVQPQTPFERARTAPNGTSGG